MIFEYKPTLLERTLMPLGILFGACMMLKDEQGRESLLKAITLQELSLLTIIILTFVFMSYRTYMINTRFKNISLDNDKLIFPCFNLRFQEIVLKRNEIQSFKQNELGIAIQTSMGNFLIKRSYFRPEKFEEFCKYFSSNNAGNL